MDVIAFNKNKIEKLDIGQNSVGKQQWGYFGTKAATEAQRGGYSDICEATVKESARLG